MNVRSKIFVILLIIPFLNSCGVSFAYNFLDWYMEWKIGGYVSLKGEQKKQAKQAIDEFHEWHRETQIPLYRDYLVSLKYRLNQGPMSGQEVHDETDKIQDLADISLEKLMPEAIDILSELNDQQAQQLVTTFVKKRGKYTEKFVGPDPEKLHKKRIKELRSELKPWIGKLSKEQLNWVEAWSRDLKPYSDLFVSQQIRWENSLETHLSNRHNKAQLDNGIRKLMFYRKDNWEEKLQAAVDYNQDISYALLARILNNLEPKQKKKLNKKIDKYISSLESIMNRQTQKLAHSI